MEANRRLRTCVAPRSYKTSRARQQAVRQGSPANALRILIYNTPFWGYARMSYHYPHKRGVTNRPIGRGQTQLAAGVSIPGISGFGQGIAQVAAGRAAQSALAEEL